jgi:hypothetical protein
MDQGPRHREVAGDRKRRSSNDRSACRSHNTHSNISGWVLIILNVLLNTVKSPLIPSMSCQQFSMQNVWNEIHCSQSFAVQTNTTLLDYQQWTQSCSHSFLSCLLCDMTWKIKYSVTAFHTVLCNIYCHLQAKVSTQKDTSAASTEPTAC